MKRGLLCLLGLALCLGITAVPARADSFSLVGGSNGGNVSFAQGMGQPLMVIETVIETAFRSDLGISFDLIQGLLSFETGPEISCTPGSNCPPGEGGGTQTVVFAGGGDFRLTGGLDNGQGIAVDDSATLLLRGFFLPGSTAIFNFPPENGGFLGTGSFFGQIVLTLIHPDLLEALGFPRDWTEGNGFVLNIFSGIEPWDPEEGRMDDAFVDRTEVGVTPVPEGGTLFLLGSGLLAAAGLLRRKFLARFQSAE